MTSRTDATYTVRRTDGTTLHVFYSAQDCRAAFARTAGARELDVPRYGNSSFITGPRA